MDGARALGVAVACSAAASGLVIGAGELYRKLAYPSKPEAAQEKEDPREEG